MVEQGTQHPPLASMLTQAYTWYTTSTHVHAHTLHPKMQSL